MHETENYGLYLTDDSSEKFLDWRNKMNGTEDSNMIKIDLALQKKADSSEILSTVLLASAWVDGDDQYTQVLNFENLPAEQNGVISVAQSASSEQRKAAREAMMCVSGQRDGALIISADGDVPQCDIPVQIILIG